VAAPLERCSGGWRLRACCEFPWPDEVPLQDPILSGWLHRGNERTLLRLVNERKPKVIVELGAWLGLTTSVLAEEAQEATIFAVDRWDSKFLLDAQLPQYETAIAALELLRSGVSLFDHFLSNLWAHRSRVFAVRADTRKGLCTLHRLGVAPDLIYIDADHREAAVRSDLESCHALFPNALLAGDDWQWREVRAAVRAFVSEKSPAFKLHCHARENWWWLERCVPAHICEGRGTHELATETWMSKRLRIEFESATGKQ